MVYEDFKVLPRRTDSDKVLRDTVFNIVKNPKYDGYHRGLASIVYKFFQVLLLQVVLLKKKFCQIKN